MNSLKLQKQLLIAESELNRAQLLAEIDRVKENVQDLTGRAKSFATIVSSVTLLMSELAGLKRGAKRCVDGAKPSWIQTMLNSAGLGLVSNIWNAFRTRDHRHRSG